MHLKQLQLHFLKVCSAEKYNYWIKKMQRMWEKWLLKVGKMCSLSSQKTIKERSNAHSLFPVHNKYQYGFKIQNKEPGC